MLEWCFSLSSCSSRLLFQSTPVPVPTTGYLAALVQNIQGITCTLLILVLIRIHFSTISIPNQVESQALVLEPKLTGTLTAQIC